MATITIKNIPKQLHKKLRERAKRHRRSLNNEVLITLEQVVLERTPDGTALLGAVAALLPQGRPIIESDEELSGLKKVGVTETSALPRPAPS